jgi:hypothetical protein
MLRGSRVTAGEVLEFGATRVVMATGSHWQRDDIGRANSRPIRGFDAAHSVFTPDELLDGMRVMSPVVVFDDDHCYLGAVLAEKLRLDGLDVTLVTPADRVSAWTVNTLEQHAIQKRVLDLRIEVRANRTTSDLTDRQSRSNAPTQNDERLCRQLRHFSANCKIREAVADASSAAAKNLRRRAPSAEAGGCAGLECSTAWGAADRPRAPP